MGCTLHNVQYAIYEMYESENYEYLIDVRISECGFVYIRIWIEIQQGSIIEISKQKHCAYIQQRRSSAVLIIQKGFTMISFCKSVWVIIIILALSDYWIQDRGCKDPSFRQTWLWLFNYIFDIDYMGRFNNKTVIEFYFR